ncbi:Cellulose synthase-like D3 [Hibiscus syriacus]|uniref:Cellulose synthase-like D3 n=1 Tax=Hibiscus syriacus TaxID=106335 RepID=A0A6A2ZFC6_HIBSY|nr:Cellulose synthase-like D3 [Hibiscus syriacus]
MGCMCSQLAAKFAFFPPSPPTYQIKKRDNGKVTVVSSSSSSSSSALAGASDDPSLDVLLIDTKLGNKIVGFYLRNPYARLTVLYSHGNGADLGHLHDLFVQLKANLRVNLMGYDYSGYGASTGKPSESNTYADIEAVYQFLQTEYGISQEDLILYGQSIGSGPTLHLAAKLPRLRGVVLHSGILSAFVFFAMLNLHSATTFSRAQKMMLSTGCMETDCGKRQGNRSGRVCVYQQGRILVPQLKVTDAMRLNHAKPNASDVQSQDSADVAGGLSALIAGHRPV